MSRSVAVRTVLAAAVAAALTAPAASSAAAPVSLKAAPFGSDLSTMVTVKNTTKRRVRGLKLTIAAPKGISASPARRSLPALRPGRSARVKIRLRSAAGAPASGRISLRVKRKGRTVARGSVAFGAAGTTPPPKPNTLAGRYFWTSQYTPNGTDQYPLYFTGDQFAYVGRFEDAWPTCAAASEDCLSYTYDAGSGQLVVNGKPATLTGHQVDYDGQTYFEVARPPAGDRWDTTLTYANSSGICPLMCTYFTENLTFRPDGTFMRGSVSSGTGPVIDWSTVPPDQRGTYEVRADGTLLLAYADGTQRVETVARYVADDGSLKPAGEGVILDGDGYFDIRD
jgi:hypothetical protein